MSNSKKVLAVFGAIIALIGGALAVAEATDTDAITAVKIVGFFLIGVGVLIFIVSLMRRTPRR
ncbi:hypothetical protein ABZ930_31180 [Streptomyces sp. NPDC046716]|uniref:hypothetical protein n=1 Tax=Streptomyces sp. NPDC046716 TaxID=3157093 RepID=UPI00340703F2